MGKAKMMTIPAKIVMSDYCVSDTILKEFYCDGEGNIKSLNHVCPGACKDGRCVEVPNIKLLFVPVMWAGNKASFDNKTQTQVDFFINAIPLKDCPDKVQIDKLNLTQNLAAAGFDCNNAPQSVLDHVNGLGINAADYDVVVGLTDSKPCGNWVGWSNGNDAIWVTTIYASVAAHELGHIYGLVDEYCSNLAGSVDHRCNDGGAPHGGTDPNYLDETAIEYCPPDGSVPAVGNRCCNWDAGHNCTIKNYGPCCLGNKNSAGGRSIMTFADVDLLAAGAGTRAFDKHDKEELATQTQLKCGNPLLMFSGLAKLAHPMFAAVSDESGSATEDSGSGSDTETPAVGYSENLTSGNVVIVDLNVSKEGRVSENMVILREGRPTITLGKKGDYNLVVVDANGTLLWSALFDLYFDYDGPVVDGVDYSDAQFNSRQVNYRVPYYPEMKEAKLYHNGAKVYSRELDFCVEDGTCGATETAETCPEDCKKDANDKICDSSADGICDPDCEAGVDPDCTIVAIPDKPCNSESDGVCETDCGPNTDPDCTTTTTQPKGGLPCIPMLSGLFALAVGFAFNSGLPR